MSTSLDTLPVSWIRPVSDGSGVTFRMYPSAARVQWLFPATGFPAQRFLRLIRPYSLPARWLKALAERGWYGGGSVDLEPDRLADWYRRVFGGTLTLADVAIYLGAEGALRKVVLAGTDRRSGGALRFVKIAETRPARAVLRHEAAMLRRLNERPDLCGMIPEVIESGEHDGCVFLVTKAGPLTPGGPGFSPEHWRFLTRIQKHTATQAALSDSPFWHALRQRLAVFRGQVAEPWMRWLNAAETVLLARAADSRFTFCLVHGDFVPWNISWGEKGIYVYDWELAADGFPRWFDVFHFHVMRRILLGGAPPWAEVLRWHARLQWAVSLPQLRWCYLLYLVEKTLHFAEAWRLAPEKGSNRVLRWMTQELRREVLAA